jgi:AraC-like DNA-binding protein
MLAPFTTIRVEYMDTPERRVFDLRRDGLKDVSVLGRCCYSRARPDLPAHKHPGVVEIHFLERGHQAFEVEGRKYDLHGGDLFVTQPSESHSTGGMPVEPCVLYWVNLRIPKPGHSLLSLPPKETTAVVSALRLLPDRQFRGSSLVRVLLDRLLEYHLEPETALRRTRMRQAVIQFLLEVIDCSTRLPPADRVALMKEVVRTIKSRPTESFRIQDLARMAGGSVSWFKTRFKEETGLSPGQFILRNKIEAACRRLLDGDEPIGQVAGELGFPTSQYFATVFQRLMGVSPRRYRQEGVAHGPSHRREDGQS